MNLHVALYFGVLIFLSALTALPGVAALILLFTFGLGLPVLFSSTILVYSLSALPLYLWVQAEERRWTLLPFAVLAMPLVPVGLPLISWKLQHAYFAQLAQDIVPERLRRPQVIEIVDPRLHYRTARSADQPIPCDDRCLSLLFSGDVREIRLTRSFVGSVRSGPNSARLSTAQQEGGALAISAQSLTYKLERQEECPADAFAGRIPPPWVKEKMADGTCLVASRGDASPPEFRITVSESLGGSASGGSFLFRPLNVRQLLVESLSGEDATLVLRRTQVLSQRLSMPLMVWYESVHGFPTELELFQVRSTRGELDVDRALRDAFGFSSPSH